MECATCQRVLTNPVTCPQCQKVQYCSIDCRIRDWGQNHHLICRQKGAEEMEKYEEITDPAMRIIGKGSFGEVRLIREKSTGNLFAMKVVNKRAVSNEGCLEVMLREIQVHKKMIHKHIIRHVESFEDQINIYMILEYAQNGSLFNEIRRHGTLPVDKAQRYFKEACLAIQFLHQNQVIHRDLKPENLLLDESYTLKICDFGWSYIGQDFRNTFCGTIEYMAPEMVNNQGHSFSVDIWALGVLLYEMLHGRSPFCQGRDIDKCQQIIQGNISFGKEAPPDAKDLILKILNLDPNKRPTIEEVLQHRFLKPNIKPGMQIRYDVKGYGQADGIVQTIMGNICEVYFQTIPLTLSMATEKAAGLIVPNQNKSILNQTTESSLNISDHENSILDSVQKWCGKGRRRRRPESRAMTPLSMEKQEQINEQVSQVRDKSIEPQESINLSMNTSLQSLKQHTGIFTPRAEVQQQKPQKQYRNINKTQEIQKTDLSLIKDQSVVLKPPLVNQDRISYYPPPPFLPELQGVDTSIDPSLMISPRNNSFQVKQPENQYTKEDSLLFSKLRIDTDEINSRFEDSIVEEVSNISSKINLQKQEFQERMQQRQNKSLNRSRSPQLSQLRSEMITPDGKIDYERQREAIKSQTLGFIHQLEQSNIWEQIDDDSPQKLNQSIDYPQLNKSRYEEYDKIIEKERKIFRKSAQTIPKNKVRIEISTAELNRRKRELENYIQEFDVQSQPSKPKESVQKRPKQRRSTQNSDQGFFKWLGRVIGCADRQ